MQIVSFRVSAFSINTCAVVTSKQEVGKAVTESYHGDKAKTRLFQLDRAKGGAADCFIIGRPHC